MSSFFRLIGRFCGDKRGNIAMTFALASLPIMSAIGCAVDYSLAVRLKVKMQSAADAASVAAISQKSPGYIAAAAMTGSGSVAAAVTDALNIFNGDLNGITGYTMQAGYPAATVTKTGVKLASNVTFSAKVPTMFMGVISSSFQTLTVTGSSSSSASLPPYLDFYLALDVSGSMGLPSTPAEAVRMQSINPDNYVQYPTGCTLACHFSQVPLNNLKSSACIDPSPNTPTGATPTQKYPTGNYCLAYDISRVSQSAYAQLLANNGGQLPTYKYTKATTPPVQVAQPTAFYSVNPLFPKDPVLTPVQSCPTDGTDACIQLRLDAVGYALTQLFITANNDEKVANQFRVGLYPFITDAYAYFPLTASINGSPNTPGTINYAADKLATQLDTNTNSNLGSGGTHVENALSEINTIIASVGDGSSATNTQPYIFLVTDGAVDPQMKAIGGGWSGSNHATVIDPTQSCQTIKARGIIISVLYIPYQPISPVNTSFAGNEDTYANNNIPNIPPSLTSCASPGFFYTANTPTDINNALQAMFNHVLQTAHITN